MKKRLILSIVVFLILFGLLWLSRHSFIQIIPASNNTGEVVYSLKNQSSGKTTIIKSSGTVKKLVRKGSYEILAAQNEKSYFSVVETGWFLGKTAIQPKLAEEKARNFIGDGPASCMHVIDGVFASLTCGDLFSEFKLHVPATTQQPTYTLKSSSTLENGIVEGLVNTSKGSVLILKSMYGVDHTAYLVNSDLELSRETVLEKLDSDKSYAVQSYKSGFLVYDSQFSQFLYYKSLGSAPTLLNIKPPSDDELLPASLKVQGDNIVVVYTNAPIGDTDESGQDTEDDREAPKKIKTVVTVTKDGQSKQYEFNKQLFYAMLCGTQKICLIIEGSLQVYDISGKKPSRSFSVKDVKAIETIDGSLLIVTNSGVLELNADTGEGYLQYSFGNRTYCGVGGLGDSYVLCLENEAQRTAALLISPGVALSDNIDKKIIELERLSEIKNVSIYGKYIYISPDFGEVTYQTSLGEFGYNPDILKQTVAKINQEVDKLNIDRDKYKISIIGAN